MVKRVKIPPKCFQNKQVIISVDRKEVAAIVGPQTATKTLIAVTNFMKSSEIPRTNSAAKAPSIAKLVNRSLILRFYSLKPRYISNISRFQTNCGKYWGSRGFIPRCRDMSWKSRGFAPGCRDTFWVSCGFIPGSRFYNQIPQHVGNLVVLPLDAAAHYGDVAVSPLVATTNARNLTVSPTNFSTCLAIFPLDATTTYGNLAVSHLVVKSEQRPLGKVAIKYVSKR